MILMMEACAALKHYPKQLAVNSARMAMDLAVWHEVLTLFTAICLGWCSRADDGSLRRPL